MKKCIHECVCPCHEAGSGVMHIMACCDPCELCDRNISNGSMEGHKEICHKDQE